jgi:hypothetical protein
VRISAAELKLDNAQKGEMKMIRTVLAACAALTLVACGGGGGAGGGTSPGGGATSFIPAAPALGEVLYTDATALHPVVPGARYAVHGDQLAADGSRDGLGEYQMTVSAGNDGGWVETLSLYRAEVLSQTPVYIANGVVSMLEQTTFVTHPTAPDIELRSPVRANDQYVITPETTLQTQQDEDNDGHLDSVRYASYRRVIGNETLQIPNLGTVTALHVDFVMINQWILSGSPSIAQPIQTTTSSTWYLAGYGVVKREVFLAGGAAEEQLTTGVEIGNSGIGMSAPAVELIPGTDANYPNQLAGQFINSVRVGNQVVALTNEPGKPVGTTYNGMLFTLLDSYGNPQSTKVYPGLGPAGLGTGADVMAPTANGFVIVHPNGGTSTGLVFVFDAQANLLNSSSDSTFDLAEPGYSVAPGNPWVATDGDGFWVALERYIDGQPETAQFVARHWNFDGTPRGPTIVLATFSTNSAYGGLGLTAANGQAFATWGTSTEFLCATLDDSETSLGQIELQRDGNMAAGPIPTPVPGGGLTFSWVSNSLTAYLGFAGLRLDASLQPIFTGTNSNVDAELLQPGMGLAAGQQFFLLFQPGIEPGQVAGVGGYFGAFQAGEWNRQIDIYAEYDMGTGSSFAGTTPRVWAASGRFLSTDGAQTTAHAFPDHVLLLGSQGGVLSATRVWR